MLTKEELIEYENDIAATFDAAKIKAPIHLYNDNEEQMIEVFKKHNIGEEDWVLGSWRSHYQCLLKGVPKDELKKANSLEHILTKDEKEFLCGCKDKKKVRKKK